jgi:hypothetical protein
MSHSSLLPQLYKFTRSTEVTLLATPPVQNSRRIKNSNLLLPHPRRQNPLYV